MDKTISRQAQAHLSWTAPLSTIKGVGDAITTKLNKLGIYCVGDLILHFPYRYQDRTRLMPIRHAVMMQEALLQGVITDCQEVKKRKNQLIITLEDGTGFIQLVFFNYYPNMKKMFQKGVMLRCFGEVRFYQRVKTIVHPEYQVVSNQTPLDSTLTPIYSSLSGLSQNWWRKTITHIFTHLHSFEHSLWATKLDEQFGISFLSAIKQIHHPEPDCDKVALLEKKNHAYQRLIFEELLAYRVSIGKLKAQSLTHQSVSISISKEAFSQRVAALPFTLTPGQQAVMLDIIEDLNQAKPMMRLLQGDVGSGKTVIALLSAFIAIKNQLQVAVMAPTEVLAEQLFRAFSEFFTNDDVSIALLVGSLKEKEKKQIVEKLKAHQCHIVIGTHALFQDKVEFARLGLVVIDEQHRFGVHQRLSLNAKGFDEKQSLMPHQLIMTATPIPRTLCMTYYAHLSYSQILMLPQGRKPIQTVVVSSQKREDILNRIVSHCHQGEQVYWVCALVDESEQLDAQDAQQTYIELSEKCVGLKVGLVHGKLKPKEKEAIMNAFYGGDIDVLVATTVIEVGVNVPNATMMIIENAERFGLSQLHQLRGRVGRGHKQSYCVLLYQGPLSRYAKDRLSTMRSTNNGFTIAEKDLELRGPGEVLGVKQSGVQPLRVANFMRDHHLISKVNQFLKDIRLDEKQSKTLMARWFQSKSEYAKV